MRKTLLPALMALLLAVPARADIDLALSRERGNLASTTSPAAKVGPKTVEEARIVLETADGLRLSGWLLPPSNANCGTVALFHGWKGSRADMTGRALDLVRAGYGVALFDHRGHADSEQANVTYGLNEAQDVVAVLGLVRALQPGKLGVIGFSMGGAAALLASQQIKADAYVLESTYSTFKETAKARAQQQGGELGALFGTLMGSLGGHGFDPDLLRPVDHLARLNRPSLIMVGDRDPSVTAEQTNRMVAAAGKNGKLVTFKGAGHTNLHKFDSKSWNAAVQPFLKQHLCTR